MKLFFLKNSTGVTYSFLPILEDGVLGTEHEIDPSDLAKVEAGTHNFDFENNQPILVESQPVEPIQENQDTLILRGKLESQTATLEEIQTALSKLL